MKILLVDDHALFREGLCHILLELDTDVTLLEAHDYDHALAHVSENTDLDLALVDLNLAGKNGFEVLTSITCQHPTIPVVILSESVLRSNIQKSLDLGAMGYISKDTSGAIMLNAIRLILSGEIYTPQNIIKDLKETTHVESHINHSLTRRQLEVLNLIALGHSNKYIANELLLTEGTVKSHITAIFKSLKVHNRTQAVIAAYKTK